MIVLAPVKNSLWSPHCFNPITDLKETNSVSDNLRLSLSRKMLFWNSRAHLYKATKIWSEIPSELTAKGEDTTLKRERVELKGQRKTV